MKGYSGSSLDRFLKFLRASNDIDGTSCIKFVKSTASQRSQAFYDILT